jgi:uncharacterized UBP type Zn finger protein
VCIDNTKGHDMNAEPMTLSLAGVVFSTDYNREEVETEQQLVAAMRAAFGTYLVDECATRHTTTRTTYITELSETVIIQITGYADGYAYTIEASL